MNFHQTRSGKSFSPWKAFGPAPNAQLDFDELMYQSIIAECSAIDSTEGYEIEPMSPPLHPVYLDCSPFSSPTPLTPPPPSPLATPTESMPALSLSPSFPILNHPAPPLATASKTCPRSNRNRSAEALYRKCKGKKREKMKKQLEKAAAPYGYYAVKPSTVNKHIKRANPHRTSKNSEDLPHVRTAYLGTRDKGGSKQVFRLEEMVGSGSRFGFELKEWDGRCVCAFSSFEPLAHCGIFSEPQHLSSIT